VSFHAALDVDAALVADPFAVADVPLCCYAAAADDDVVVAAGLHCGQVRAGVDSHYNHEFCLTAIDHNRSGEGGEEEVRV